jgi:integrase
VGIFLDQWLAMKHNLRANSLRTYRSSIDTLIKPYLGNIKLSRLEASQIEVWQASLLKREISKSAVTGARSLLWCACEKAVRMKLLKHNPVSGTDGIGRGKPKNKRHISFDEAQRLIQACEGERFGVLFQLAIRTGLRAEELLGLTWEDMELTGNRGALRVRRVVHHPAGGGWIWQEPKSENGKRRVLFPGEIVSKLIEHRRSQLEEKLKAGQFWQHNDLVFANRIGEPIRYCILRKHFKALLEKAGLPAEIGTHKLRHFHVTLGLASGVDIKTVSREVGHARASFTADHYGEVVDEMFESACDKREEMLRRKRR